MGTATGIDVGFNAVKALASNDRRAHFPSVVGIEQTRIMELPEDLVQDKGRQERLVIEMANGQTWSVGHTALRESAYSAGRQDPGWIKSPSYQVLVCTALSELHKGTTSTHVVSGLPLEDWGTWAPTLREVLTGKHRFRRNGGSWQTVTVEEAVVITQPYGSLLDQALAENGRILDNVWATGAVAVADLGGNTVNLLVTDALEEVGQWTRGDGLGLLKALDQIARAIHSRYSTITPRSREVSEWLARGTFKVGDQELQIAPYAAPYLEPLVELVLNRCASVWDEPGRYQAVLLTGGGALALGQALKARMRGVYSNVTIAPEPVFANVRGYLKLARKLWG